MIKIDQTWKIMKGSLQSVPTSPHTAPTWAKYDHLPPSTSSYPLYIYILYKMENDWEIPVNWDLIPSNTIHNHPYIFSII